VEVSPAWPKEALMAQAIAARTYALYIREKNAEAPYDLEASAFSQVYGGFDAEAGASTHAVDATRGKVITFEGKPIIACFHANSAGHTEDAREVWGFEIPYLKGIPDKFSKEIPGAEWEFFLPYQTAGKRLALVEPNLRTIRRLEAVGKSASGRVRTVRISSDGGDFELTGNNFRIRIGGTELRSTLFEAQSDARGVRFRGVGYGHGVGMSQWGANRMAQSGYRHEDILKFYYRGVEITNDFR
jgi:stage II sporulation protein D